MKNISNPSFQFPKVGNTQKQGMRILFLLVFLFSIPISAQYHLGGTQNLNVGGSGFYFVNNSGGATITSTTWSVTPSSSVTITPQGTNQASITFNAVGTYAVKATVNGSTATSDYQVIVTNPPPPNPSDPTVTSTTCGQATLSRSGNPPSGVTWYWQGKDSNSYHTNLGNGSTYTANQGSGTYYIRARYNSTLTWSTSLGSVAVTITSSTSTPNASADNPTVCSGNSTFITASNVSGATYKWYDANDNYLNQTGSVFNTGNLSSTTTFKVSATINGCESPKRSVTISVTSPPSATTLSADSSQICSNQSGILTLTGTQSDVDYQLLSGSQTVGNVRTSSTGTIIWNTGITAGTYKVRASNSNGSCSIVESNTVDISVRAATPITITTDQPNNNQICPNVSNVTLIAGNIGSSGIIEWLDPADNVIGNSTTQSVSLNAGTSNIFTLRAYNDCNVIVDTEITLAVLPALGNVSVPSGDASRCGGAGNSTYTATALNAQDYSWEISPLTAGTISNTGYVEWDPNFYGNATITVTANGTCGQQDSESTVVTVTQLVTYYHDEDRDGYYTITAEACENPDPTYYVETGILGSGDCNDKNDQIHPETVWFLDADGDRYSPNTQTVIQCTSPGPDYNFGFKSDALDCDDSNSNVRTVKWYEDTDNDGLGEPDGNTLQQCDQPSTGNYVENNNDLCPNDALNTCGAANSGPLCNTDNLNLTVTGDNHVYSRTYQTEMQNGPNRFVENDNVIQQISYFDGLGRPIQQVGIDASPSKNDMITHIGYDGFGRAAKEWLPYVDLDPTAGLGTFRNGAELETNTYYVTNYGQDIAAADPNPFSQKSFDGTPLNRVLSQAAPGAAWAKDGGHEIEFEYETNVSGDNVRQLAVALNASDNTYAPTLVFLKDEMNNDVEFYAAGELYKNITYDENHDGTSSKNHSTEEFTDKQGRVVLKRTYADMGATMEVPHDTYYVYDDFGNLTYVLPPKMDASSALLSDLNNEMDELGYQYVYDHRNRMVEKKIPGKGWEHVIYNKLNQPIMTQDSVQRVAGEWLFTKYDAFGRVAYTGKTTDNRAREVIQTTTVDPLSTNLWVNVDNAWQMDGITIGYDNTAYPTSIMEVLTVNYYDSYAFVNNETWPTTPTVVFDAGVDLNVKGMASGSRVKVLGTTNWITTATYYDAKGQAIYTYSENKYLGTVDIVESDLDFVGRPVTVRSAHTRSANTIVTVDNFTYDHMGRLLKQTQCIGDDTLGYTCSAVSALATKTFTEPSVTTGITVTDWIEVKPTLNPVSLTGSLSLRIDPNANSSGGNEELIVYNSYDELGQLAAKKVGGTPNADYAYTTGLQTVDYAYNVRGWLKSINQDTNTQDNDLFDFVINYNTVDHGGTALYNGNIAETQWQTANDNVVRWYNYGYDALNRITAATSYNGDYDVSHITYDKHGNIKTLQREGHNGPMDNLTYAYHEAERSNRLKSVADSATNEGFVDGVTAGVEYTYDGNGNMLTDDNKGITNINYNHLNLPTSVTINSATITYIYDAAGVKIRKTASNGSSLTITDYAGNFIYSGDGTNTQLEFLSQPEGYTSPDGSGGYDYVYQYKDHLGNVRLSFMDNNGTVEIIEENNYYPFGLKHQGYNNAPSSLGNDVANRWKFGGKEYQDEFDLAWYDVSARNYDPALGRWMNLDPLAEQMRRHSPYNYAFDNPVFFIDPDGMKPDWIRKAHSDGTVTYTAEKGDSALSLYQQYGDQDGFSLETANEIVETQHGSNYVGKDGKLKSNLEIGDIVSVGFGSDIEVSKDMVGDNPDLNQIVELEGFGNSDEELSNNSSKLEIQPDNDKSLLNKASDAIRGESVIPSAAGKLLKRIMGAGAGSMMSTIPVDPHEDGRVERMRLGIPLNSSQKVLDSARNASYLKSLNNPGDSIITEPVEH